VVTIVLEPSSPYKRWRDLVLLTLRRYALDDHVLSNVVNPSIYWARLDNIVVTWIRGTLSPELHKIVREPMETARQVPRLQTGRSQRPRLLSPDEGHGRRPSCLG
jgi:hypothetical protein